MTSEANDPTAAIAVLITAPNSDEAAKLAEMLVGRRLAACVQILPGIESVYRWQGKIERQPEVLILVKTTRARFDELERGVRAIHSYETPEIVGWPLTLGSAPYLEWLSASLQADVNEL
ncbi:MAG TPA: divalent-cation tolerance protein CutA [Pyrinomonadaceae bacterium]|nr:divalent-cation tolerance protein CutA [Pyrinomonadaceae bacterium]